MGIYIMLVKFNIYNLANSANYNNHKFEFVLTMLGSLLTIYGLMFSLPENKYRKLMRKYGHDKIINNTIFIGIISSIIFILLLLFDLFAVLQDLLFLVICSEVCIATFKIYFALKFISKRC